MKRFLIRTLQVLAALVILLLIGLLIFIYTPPRHSIEAADYGLEKGMTEAEIEQQVDDWIKAMTLEEKVAQMSGDGGMWEFARFGLRALILKERANYYSGRNERLGIPPFSFADGPRGIVTGEATAFPVAMARGASWDKALEQRVVDAMGVEARALGANYHGGLCINVLRHPAWGRAQETYGESPWQLGEMGIAFLRGEQRHNVMTCAKHFAANNIENSRFYVDMQMDERTLREVYLPQFRRCVDAGLASVMSAYNKLNNEYCGHNDYLLTQILRDEWGFEGFVSSDWVWGIYDAAEAANAGMDVEMPAPLHYGDKLVQAVQNDEVPEEQIDTIVRRILRTKLRYVTAPDPMNYDKSLINNEAHRKLAQEAAEKSIVLMKNNDALLPLSKEKTGKLAVIGHLAKADNLGDEASSHFEPSYVVTPLEGLQQYLGEATEVVYNDGRDIEAARTLATDADAVIIVAGYGPQDEGENIGNNPWQEDTVNIKGGDRRSLSLHREDIELIRAVGAVNERSVVTLIGGSAILMDEWIKTVPAVLMAWYPGMEGGTALARILFGEVSPSGRLPFTHPADEQQLPPFDPFEEVARIGYYHGYTLFDKENMEPAYPLGYGLSYTSFRLDSLRVLTPAVSPGDSLRVQVRLTNTGAVTGGELVQLYIGLENAGTERPPKLLRDFKKVYLKPGEFRFLTLKVAFEDLAWYSPNLRQWVVDKVPYSVLVGRTARDAGMLKGSFEVGDYSS